MPSYSVADWFFRTSTSVELLSEPRQLCERRFLLLHVVLFSDELANSTDGHEHSQRIRNQRLEPVAFVKRLAARDAIWIAAVEHIKHDDRDANGVGGTLYGGYNFQNGQIVYGAEADVSYNGEDGSAGAGLTGTQGVNGSLRGRVGYDMNPFLIYGTAGVAAADHKIESATDEDSQVAVGYTVGAGVEALVTDNIMARVEYRYTDYASRDFDIDGAKVSRGFDDHSVKVGIGVKF